MTAKAYADIIQSLGNKVQKAIAAAPEKRNLLVPAGPGFPRFYAPKIMPQYPTKSEVGSNGSKLEA